MKRKLKQFLATTVVLGGVLFTSPMLAQTDHARLAAEPSAHLAMDPSAERAFEPLATWGGFPGSATDVHYSLASIHISAAVACSSAAAASSSGCFMALRAAALAFVGCEACTVAIGDPDMGSIVACVACVIAEIHDDEDVEECAERIRETVRRWLERS